MTETSSNIQPTDQERLPADHAMCWYGWGSPVGLSILIVALGTSAALIRYAIVGPT